MNTILLVWAALAAQQPDTASHPALTRALLAARDSVGAVRRTGATFRRDLGAASPDLVVARSRQVRVACNAAITTTAALDQLLAGEPADRAAAARDRLRRSITELHAALTRCASQFDPDVRDAPVDSLRVWGPYRLELLETILRRYELAAQQYAGALGLRYSS